MFAKHWLLRKDAFRRSYQLIICIIIFCGNYQPWPWCGQITGQGWLQQGTTQLRPIKWDDLPTMPRLPSLVRDPKWQRCSLIKAKVLAAMAKKCTEVAKTEQIPHASSACDHCTFLLIFAISPFISCWSKEHQYLCAGSGGHISNTQWLLNCLWIHFSDNLKSVTWAFPSTCYYLK